MRTIRSDEDGKPQVPPLGLAQYEIPVLVDPQNRLVVRKAFLAGDFIFLNAQESGDESPAFDSSLYNNFVVFLEANDTGSGIDMDVQIQVLTPSGAWCVIDQRHLGETGVVPVQFSGAFASIKIALANYNIGALTASIAARAD